jgi:hypothetical protein
VSTSTIATYAEALNPRLASVQRNTLDAFFSAPPESFEIELARAFLAVHASLGFTLNALAPDLISRGTADALSSMPIDSADSALIAHRAISSLLYPSPNFPSLPVTPLKPSALQALYWVDSSALLLCHAAAHGQDPHFKQFCDSALAMSAQLSARAAVLARAPFPALHTLLQYMRDLAPTLEAPSI